MKRKVALLLALVMVIAMLPMNVFGARGTITGIRTNTDEANFTVNIDAVDFRARATTPVGLFIEFTVTDGEFPNHQYNLQNANNYPNTSAARDWRAHEDFAGGRRDRITWQRTAGSADFIAFADWLNEGTLTRWSATRLTLELPDPPAAIEEDAGANVLANNLAGIFTREIRVNPSNSNARLTVTLNGVDAQGRHTTLATLAQNNLIAGVDAGVTITAGASVPLVGASRINNISIRENNPGALAPTAAAGATPHNRVIPIRLVAPNGFVWALGQDMAAIGGTSFAVTNAGNAAIPAENISDRVITDVPDTNGRDTIIVLADLRRSSALLAQNERAQINLTNLWLIATADAPASGNANIEVAIGYIAESIVAIPSTPEFATPNFTGLRWAVPQSDDNGHRNMNIAWLADQSFTERHGTGTDVAAPLRGQLVRSWQANPWNAYGGHEDGDTGARPANRNVAAWRNLNLTVAHLGVDSHIEVIDDAFDRPVIISGGYQTSWHANHGIIRFRETAQATLFRGVEIYTVRLLQDGVSFVDVRARATHMPRLNTGTANRGGWWGSGDRGDIRDYHTMAGTRIEENVITIMPSPVGAADIYTGLRNFDLQFLLSVEAGFAQHYGEVLAEVTIFPHGVRETVVLAYVEDPIGVAPVTPLTIVRPTAAGFDHLPPTFVPDVTIYEHDYGTLEVGDRIWLYLEGIHAPTGRITSHPTWPTNFYTSRDPIITGGLRLSYQGFEETVAGSGIMASVFIVTAPSVDTPSRITFTGNFISGFVSSGNDYQVIIGGSSIARNSYANFPADERNEYSANETYGLNPLFGGLTYATTIVEVRTHAPDPIGPGPGPQPEQRRLSLSPYMTSITLRDGSAVADPFFFWNNTTAPQYRVGMLSLAVFADFIHGTPQWVAPQATVTGNDRNGNPVTVVLTQGSNFATINGVQHDIATFAGASGPSGSIQPQNIDGRIFLPLRFIANAFLYPIGMEGGIVTLG